MRGLLVSLFLNDIQCYTGHGLTNHASDLIRAWIDESLDIYKVSGSEEHAFVNSNSGTSLSCAGFYGHSLCTRS